MSAGSAAAPEPVEVAVLAGRGKTGRAVCRALTGAGARPRPLGRADAARLDDALVGCSALHLMAPNLHPDEPAYVSTVLAAARAAGVRRVVYHSVTAPYVPDLPHHLGKARSEDLVRRSGLEWTLLQPCAYVQNLVPGLLAAGRDGAPEPAVRVPYDPDRLFGLVDLVDVAAAAAVVLLDDGHAGATYELGGPRLVSTRDVALAAGRVLGRDVPVERTPIEAAASDADPRERDWLRAMFAYYDRHGLPAAALPLRALLGRDTHDLTATLTRELTPEAPRTVGR